jgi:hypothetical protein
VPYIETLARDWHRLEEAKHLAHRELRDARALDARLRKIVLR